MKKYNIVVAKADRQDPEKKHWKNVGTLLYFEPSEAKPEAGFIIELNMFPTTDFKVFAATEKKPDASQPQPQEPKDDVNPDDIPF